MVQLNLGHKKAEAKTPLLVPLEVCRNLEELLSSPGWAHLKEWLHRQEEEALLVFKIAERGAQPEAAGMAAARYLGTVTSLNRIKTLDVVVRKILDEA